MIDLKKCIVCSTAENLNTSMSFKLEDGNTVEVIVCDEHSEDLTKKQAREQYIEKREELERIIEMAKAAGLDVRIPTEGLAIATSTELAVQPKAPPPTGGNELKQMTDAENAPDYDNLLPAAEARSKLGSAKSVGGSVGGSQIERQVSHDRRTLDDKVDIGEEKIQVGIVEGRGGSRVSVPAVIQDDTGTTHIAVKQQMNDHMLQRNFKALSDSSDGDGNNTHCFGSEGYTVRDCGFCKGECTIPSIDEGKKVRITCPKCNGTGMLSRTF